MGTTYGQSCPVAKAMEPLDERWTMLLVRERVAGSERFNAPRRGLPRMSPSLLSKRLQQLERAGHWWLALSEFTAVERGDQPVQV